MNIIFILIPLSLLLVAFAGWGFFWAVNAGQFDDLESPGWDVLRDEAAVASDPPLSAESRISDLDSRIPPAESALPDLESQVSTREPLN
jgi:cbb3-type cytochrome oxidase maturation protein